MARIQLAAFRGQTTTSRTAATTTMMSPIQPATSTASPKPATRSLLIVGNTSVIHTISEPARVNATVSIMPDQSRFGARGRASQSRPTASGG